MAKFVTCSAQRLLGIVTKVARQIDHTKQQVAQLHSHRLWVAVECDCLTNLGRLFNDLFKCSIGVWPVETNICCSFLNFCGVLQRGPRLCNASKCGCGTSAVSRFFLCALHIIPCLHYVVGTVCYNIPKYVWVSTHQLVVY